MLNPELRVRLISAALALSLSITACFEGKKQVPDPRTEKTPVVTPSPESTTTQIPPTVVSPGNTPEVTSEVAVQQLYSQEYLNSSFEEKILLTTTIEEVLTQMGMPAEEITNLLEENQHHLEASGLVQYLEKVGELRNFKLEDLYMEVYWHPLNGHLVDDGKTWTGESSKNVPTLVMYDVGNGAYVFPVLRANQERVEYSSDEPDISMVVAQDMNSPFNMNAVRNNIPEINYLELLSYLKGVTKVQSYEFAMKVSEMRTANTYSNVLTNPFTGKIVMIRTK
jgi:hypothetical protein